MPLAKINQVSGSAVYVPGDDIDTDRIIPARFMKCVTFDGLGEYLFHDVRYDEQGQEKIHSLNDNRFGGSSIMLSGKTLDVAVLGNTPHNLSTGQAFGPSLLGTLLKSSLATRSTLVFHALPWIRKNGHPLPNGLNRMQVLQLQ
jgi:hypothetical protein